MASHSNPEQSNPPEETTQTDGDPEPTEEELAEEWRKWLSNVWEPEKKKPMKLPLTAPLDIPISDTDLKKLKTGFRNKSQDDKWDMLVESPDANGNVSIHISRVLVREPAYTLHIVEKGREDEGGSAKITGITWEGNKAGKQCDAEQALKEAVILCRGHLKCEFEALPEYPPSAFWDWKVYKKLDAE